MPAPINFAEKRAGKIFRLYTGFKDLDAAMIYLFEVGNNYETYYRDAIFLNSRIQGAFEYFADIPVFRLPIHGARAKLMPILKLNHEIGICARDPN
ncbi:MAG: hypothetical protein HN416_13860 [Nitrospina sp.]|jgi:hypothetical protein|nr:hypothetical protein [Nitrospina sp.]